MVSKSEQKLSALKGCQTIYEVVMVDNGVETSIGFCRPGRRGMIPVVQNSKVALEAIKKYGDSFNWKGSALDFHAKHTKHRLEFKFSKRTQRDVIKESQ